MTHSPGTYGALPGRLGAPSVRRLARVAQRLGESLRGQVVFIGAHIFLNMRYSIRRVLPRILLSLAIAHSPASLHAQSPCVSASLADYIGRGPLGCTVGGMRMFNFSAWSGVSFYRGISLSTITIAPFIRGSWAGFVAPAIGYRGYGG